MVSLVSMVIVVKLKLEYVETEVATMMIQVAGCPQICSCNYFSYYGSFYAGISYSCVSFLSC